jgi:uncharacterized protein
MKLVIFGATGHIGRAITAETLQRGHDVTAVVRDLSRLSGAYPKLDVVAGDIARPTTYADTLRHADAVIVSISARRDGDPTLLARHADIVLEAAAKARVGRLAWVGGAASLEVKPGVRVIDDPHFPAAWRPEAEAQAEALAVFRASKANIDWVYLSPAALIEDGERTGNFRIGGDQLLVDADGKSRISVADFAAALVDRIEQNDHPRQRITVAY